MIDKKMDGADIDGEMMDGIYRNLSEEELNPGFFRRSVHDTKEEEAQKLKIWRNK